MFLEINKFKCRPKISKQYQRSSKSTFTHTKEDNTIYIGSVLIVRTYVQLLVKTISEHSNILSTPYKPSSLKGVFPRYSQRVFTNFPLVFNQKWSNTRDKPLTLTSKLFIYNYTSSVFTGSVTNITNSDL